MDIIYKKDTLYVYLDESLDDARMSALESRIDHIMSTYNIEHLVVKSADERSESLERFENKFNARHHSKMIIK